MQHDGLVIKIAFRFLPLLDRASDMEDLLQAGRLGVLLAQSTYDAGKGAFGTWAGYYIRTEMETALNLRGRKRPDRLAVSLDRPIPGAEELTLLDTLPDRTDMEEEALAKGTDAYIQAVVHTCLDALPWEQRMAVQLCDLDGMNNEQAAAFLGIGSGSKVRSLRGKGQCNLRRMPRMRLLAWECGLAPPPLPVSPIGERRPGGVAFYIHAEFSRKKGCRRIAKNR